jgi:hypothetical protein
VHLTDPNNGSTTLNRLPFFDREPDNLTVIAIGAAVLKSIEECLLDVVDITTPAIWWMNDNVHYQRSGQRSNSSRSE